MYSHFLSIFIKLCSKSSTNKKRIFTIDGRADLVVGHHPHVIQGIEQYKGKMIVYSLGNFMFGGNKNPSDKDTFVYQQKLTNQHGSYTKNKV